MIPGWIVGRRSTLRVVASTGTLGICQSWECMMYMALRAMSLHPVQRRIGGGFSGTRGRRAKLEQSRRRSHEHVQRPEGQPPSGEGRRARRGGRGVCIGVCIGSREAADPARRSLWPPGRGGEASRPWSAAGEAATRERFRAAQSRSELDHVSCCEWWARRAWRAWMQTEASA